MQEEPVDIDADVTKIQPHQQPMTQPGGQMFYTDDGVMMVPQAANPSFGFGASLASQALPP